MIGLIPNTPSEHTLARIIVGCTDPASISEELWMELVPLAIAHNLGPMLAWVLQKKGLQLQENLCWGPLITEARVSFLRLLSLNLACRRFASALEHANIPMIWLKGIGLAHSVYPAPQLRPMLDLDVLLPLDRIKDARQAAEALYYQPAEIDFAALMGFADSVRHHDHLVDRRGQVQLEMHFSLLVPDLQRRLLPEQMAWFWEQTHQNHAAGKSFTVFNPEANLLYLCAHAILQHHHEPLSLLRLLDLHFLVMKSHMNWDLVVSQAVNLRWAYTVERALSLTQSFFETPLPGNLFADLRGQRRADDLLPENVYAQEDVGRWEEWKYMFQHMTLRRRLRLVRMTLLPPPAFLRQLYTLPLSQPLFFFYFRHWFDGGSEAVRALSRRWLRSFTH